MLWNIAPRLSVYLIAVLSISRTVSLIYPLRHSSRKETAAPILVYTVLQIVQATLPFWFGATLKFGQTVFREVAIQSRAQSTDPE